MLRKLMALTAVTVLATASIAAQAQPGPGRGFDHGGRPGDGRGGDGWGGDGRGSYGRGGYMPPHGWNRGDYYNGPRDQRYAIQDWRRHRGLWAPRRGYYWVQSGNQYLLTAIATGLVAGVVGGAIVASAPPPGAVYAQPGYAQPGYAQPGYGPPPPPYGR